MGSFDLEPLSLCSQHRYNRILKLCGLEKDSRFLELQVLYLPNKNINFHPVMHDDVTSMLFPQCCFE